MASLTAKVIHGHTYYYARECQRINGRPKIVRTIYLGSADDLIAAALRRQQGQVPQPHSVASAAFGDVVALYDLAQQIGLVALLDRHLPKRTQGLSVGQYLLLAAINRAVHPTSKLRFADWYRTTTLPRLLPATAKQLSSQAFWNHLDLGATAFKQRKHPHDLGWQPMYHWTDSKIRVHAFTCVLALTLSSLLQRTLHQKGVDLSLPRMFELLGGIREALVIYPKKQGQRHPTIARTLSTLTAEQEQLLTALDLRRYL